MHCTLYSISLSLSYKSLLQTSFPQPQWEQVPGLSVQRRDTLLRWSHPYPHTQRQTTALRCSSTCYVCRQKGSFQSYLSPRLLPKSPSFTFLFIFCSYFSILPLLIFFASVFPTHLSLVPTSIIWLIAGSSGDEGWFRRRMSSFQWTCQREFLFFCTQRSPQGLSHTSGFSKSTHKPHCSAIEVHFSLVHSSMLLLVLGNLQTSVLVLQCVVQEQFTQLQMWYQCVNTSAHVHAFSVYPLFPDWHGHAPHRTRLPHCSCGTPA